MTAPRVILTVGHSAHALEHLAGLLAAQDVTALADVRRWPRSRRHPHFDDDALAVELAPRGVTYTHVPELGGRREPVAGSPNDGFAEAAMRGYADHVATAEFARGLAHLEALAAGRRTAVLCAEADWRRCHRRLVADVLAVRGWEVVHVGPGGGTEPHALTPFAVVSGGLPVYPAAQLGLGL
ncbi:DUF488 domain-containing protein [Baekduia soli]|uniref:DUF488 domain-containing protein n=1 Tax=Baekduia soli TaxID=496014 RepID=UPI001652ADC7|nr:DUF488 domain-containing protein [Baekduia soli]